MYSNKAKVMVAEQVINMLANNTLEGNAGESFIGWLEDGEIFRNAGCYTAEEIDEAMSLARKISDDMDNISWELDVTRVH